MRKPSIVKWPLNDQNDLTKLEKVNCKKVLVNPIRMSLSSPSFGPNDYAMGGDSQGCSKPTCLKRKHLTKPRLKLKKVVFLNKQSHFGLGSIIAVTLSFLLIIFAGAIAYGGALTIITNCPTTSGLLTFLTDSIFYVTWFLRGLGIAVVVVVLIYTRFKIKTTFLKRQILKFSVALSFLLCALALSSIIETPVVQAETVAATGDLYLSQPPSFFDWFIGKFSNGNYFAINGSNWNDPVNTYPWQPSPPWVVFKNNSTALTEQCLSSLTFGTVYMKEVPFNLTLMSRIPVNVTVTSNSNGATYSYINPGSSFGSPYTVSVGQGPNTGYYLAVDSGNRIAWASINATTVINDTVLPLLANGGTIHLSPGSYNISGAGGIQISNTSNPNWNPAQITLEGSGVISTTLTWGGETPSDSFPSTNAAIFTINFPYGSVVLKDMEIFGAMHGQYGVRCVNVGHLQIEQVKAGNFSVTAYDVACYDALFLHSDGSDCGNGVLLNANHVTIIGGAYGSNSLQGGYGCGILAGCSDLGHSVASLSVLGVDFEGDSYAGIKLDNVNGALISGCYFANNGQNVVSSGLTKNVTVDRSNYYETGTGYSYSGFAVTTPLFPSSAVAVQNTNTFSVRIYILTAGTTTSYTLTDLAGVTQTIVTTLFPGMEITLDPDCKIQFEYSVQPSWKWYGVS